MTERVYEKLKLEGLEGSTFRSVSDHAWGVQIASSNRTSGFQAPLTMALP